MLCRAVQFVNCRKLPHNCHVHSGANNEEQLQTFVFPGLEKEDRLRRHDKCARKVDPLSGNVASTILDLDRKLKNLDRRSIMHVSGVESKPGSKLMGVAHRRTSPGTPAPWRQSKHYSNILRT